jgi:hypothetical protein
MADSNLGESGTTGLLPRRQISTINPAKAGLQSGIKNSLTLAAQGAQAGPFGALAGLGAGIGLGVKDYFAAKAEHLKETDEFDTTHANAMTTYKDSKEGSMRKEAALDEEALSRNLLKGNYMKDGGTLDLSMDLVKQLRTERKAKKEGYDVHRSGGAINVIAKGVRHEDNNMIGDKGIPVVTKGNKKKIAEIEKNELVIHNEKSKEIERLTEEHLKNPEDKDILKQLGELMKHEIINNTVDNQGELL